MKLLLALLLFVAAASARNSDSSHWDYGYYIEANHMASVVHFYGWVHRENNRTLPNLQAISQASTLPVTPHQPNNTALYQLGVWVDSPELDVKVADHLAPLTDWMRNQLPEDHWDSTNVFVGGSDGMRSLPIYNQSAIWASVRKFIRENTTFVLTSDAQVNTITVTEESTYNWIATNALLNQLHQNNVTTSGCFSLREYNLFLSFETPSTYQNVTVDFRRPRHLFDVYNIFAGSQANYGLEPFYLKYLSFLAGVTGGASNSSNWVRSSPCHFQGDRFNYTMSNRDYNFIGTGDWTYCNELVNQMIPKGGNCTRPPCAFDDFYVPASVTAVPELVVIDDAFWPVDLIFPEGATEPNANTTLWSIRNSTNHTLTLQSWSTLNGRANLQGLTEDERRGLAFASTYVTALLNRGLGFSFETTKITYASFLGVNNTRVEWPLGAMFHRVVELPIVPTSASLATVSLSLFAMMLVHLLF